MLRPSPNYATLRLPNDDADDFQVLAITHYLVDYIFVGSANDSSCLNSLLSFGNLAQDIGIPLTEGKRCPPSTCQIVYGINIDTTTMQLRLSADKLAKAISSVNTVVNCRKISLRNVLSLIGLLSHCCLVVSAGRSFLSRLINLTCGVTRLHYHVTLNCEARADLYEWQVFLQSLNGKRMFIEQRFLSSHTIKLYTAASSAAVFWKEVGSRCMAQTVYFDGYHPS